ncbi:hypothetical protein QNI22_18885 [Cytophagaceae bacterium BD1B2-1]|uniref:Uncharacterized protein n=1 Tax=Xanthocytophaga agilis TaxID=3048010 RepID=A0AAE3UFU6_9BACT|nr:hypothetical protein [Xanthocytophaga agilis]
MDSYIEGIEVAGELIKDNVLRTLYQVTQADGFAYEFVFSLE